MTHRYATVVITHRTQHIRTVSDKGSWCHLGTKGQFRLQSLNVTRTDNMWFKAAVVLTLTGKCYVSAARGRNKKGESSQK